eukprot:2322630-Rhodomonas_salina.1
MGEIVARLSGPTLPRALSIVSSAEVRAECGASTSSQTGAMTTRVRPRGGGLQWHRRWPWQQRPRCLP